jgi:transposase
MIEAWPSDRQVARRFRVSRMPVNRWRPGAGCGRPGGAGVQGACGAKCKLTAAQVAELEAVLDAGPCGGGVCGSVLDSGPGRGQAWRRFGVEYTLAGMDVLLHRIGWSAQVPARRATERDEEKVAIWREDTWPVI